MKLKSVVIFGSVLGVVVVVSVVLFLTAIWSSQGSSYVPNEVRDSKSCVAGGKRGVTFENEKRRTITVAAWILGVREGLYASWVKQVRDGTKDVDAAGMKEWLDFSRGRAAAADESAARMAQTLRVDRPMPFSPTSLLAGLNEFRTSVESETQPTAQGLAAAYSPEICEVYKMGMYWGFSIPFRMAAPNDSNAFAPEIGYYADKVGLPPQLRQALTEPSLTDASPEQAFENSEQLSRRIAEFWNMQ